MAEIFGIAPDQIYAQAAAWTLLVLGVFPAGLIAWALVYSLWSALWLAGHYGWKGAKSLTRLVSWPFRRKRKAVEPKKSIAEMIREAGAKAEAQINAGISEDLWASPIPTQYPHMTVETWDSNDPYFRWRRDCELNNLGKLSDEEFLTRWGTKCPSRAEVREHWARERALKPQPLFKTTDHRTLWVNPVLRFPPQSPPGEHGGLKYERKGYACTTHGEIDGPLCVECITRRRA